MPQIANKDFRMKYGSQLPGGEENIGWAWYDTQLYTSTTTTVLQFFNSTNANKVRCNMEVNGQLAAPKYFVIYAIRVIPWCIPTAQTGVTQTAAFTNLWLDMFNLTFLSRLVLTVGSKDYTNMPGHYYPAGSGVTGQGIAALFGITTAQVTSSMYANNGVPDPRSVNVLARPRLIEPQINFGVNMYWNAAVTLSGNTDVQVLMDGILFRPIQ